MSMWHVPNDAEHHTMGEELSPTANSPTRPGWLPGPPWTQTPIIHNTIPIPLPGTKQAYMYILVSLSDTV